MKAFRLVRIGVAAFAATLGLALSIAPTAQARTFEQAKGDAVYYSAVDCPHHSRGRCGSRASGVTAGIGGGRWTAVTQGWECAWYNLSSCSRQSATWYYSRTFIIENDGSRSHVSGFSDDG